MKFIKTPVIGLVIALLFVGGSAIFFYTRYQKSQAEIAKLKENPQTQTLEETKKLVEEVGKIVELPQGEDPTVATVTDKDRLKDQVFFARAENGDKVLIYTQAKKAVLYRPGTKKIIEVAPVNIGTTSATPVVKMKVAIYNGTGIGGLTNKVEDDLKGKANNVEVTTKSSAQKNDYEKTLVVDILGTKKQAAEQLAKVVGGEVGLLPEGERKPDDAEFLIIAGNDYGK